MGFEKTMEWPGAATSPKKPREKQEDKGGWKEKIKNKIKEFTAEDSKLGQIAEKAVAQIEKLSKSDKLKLLSGIANLGYRTTEFKGHVFGNMFHKMSEKTKGNKFLNTWFNKEANLYAESGKKAEQARTSEDKKDISRLSGLGQGLGNCLKYGRLLYDASLANPFRHVMAASMFIGKRSEALKETRFEYEGAKENTRVQGVDRAMEEAWDLHDKARAESKDGVVTAKELEQLYKDNLPKDIEKRLARTDFNGMNFIEKGMNRHMKWAAERLMAKIKKIESSNITAKEKDAQKQALMARNEKLMNDLDSMVGDQGIIDNISYAARLAEKSGKTVAMAMMVESIPRFAKIAAQAGGWGLGKGIGYFTGTEAHAAEVPVGVQAKTPEEIKAFREGERIRVGLPEARIVSGEHGYKWTSPDGKEFTTKYGDDTIVARKVGDKLVIVESQAARGTPLVKGNEITISPEKELDESKLAVKDKEKIIFDTARIDMPSDEIMAQATVNKGEGVSHAIMRQLIGGDLKDKNFDPDFNHLKEMGYKGSDDKAAIERWARNQAGKIVKEQGYYDTEKGKQTWVMKPGESAYVLHGDKDSGFIVGEYHDRNGDGKFTLAELEIDKEDIAKPYEKEVPIQEAKAFTGEPEPLPENEDLKAYTEEFAGDKNIRYFPDKKVAAIYNEAGDVYVEEEVKGDKKSIEAFEQRATAHIAEKEKAFYDTVGEDKGLTPEIAQKLGINAYDDLNSAEKGKLDFLKAHPDFFKSEDGLKVARQIFYIGDKSGISYEDAYEYHNQVIGVVDNNDRISGVVGFLKNENGKDLGKIFGVEINDKNYELKGGVHRIKDVMKDFDIVTRVDKGVIKFGVDGPFGKWNWGAGGRSWRCPIDAELTSDNIKTARAEINEMGKALNKSGAETEIADVDEKTAETTTEEGLLKSTEDKGEEAITEKERARADGAMEPALEEPVTETPAEQPAEKAEEAPEEKVEPAEQPVQSEQPAEQQPYKPPETAEETADLIIRTKEEITNDAELEKINTTKGKREIIKYRDEIAKRKVEIDKLKSDETPDAKRIEKLKSQIKNILRRPIIKKYPNVIKLPDNF